MSPSRLLSLSGQGTPRKLYGEEIHLLSIHPGEVVFYVTEWGLNVLIEPIGQILFASLLLRFS
ncbi:MAG: hypothetical protein VYB74_06995, partial [Cyanobacteriota bacterium]|nr:hypothetical protein [Cyanobacteriota bacterium]